MTESDRRIYANLLSFAVRRPLAQPQDFVKRLYQSELGGGHMISDEQACMAYLRQEVSGLSEAQLQEDIFEPMEGDFCLMNLSAVKAVSVELIGRIFIESAKEVAPDAQEQFLHKLTVLQALCAEQPDKFAFSAEELTEYIQSFRESGMPLLRHSEAYREAYHPAYRVVRREFAELWQLLVQMERILKEKGTVRLAIDGDSGSGKTTTARWLQKLYDCNVFHADDFYLPRELRIPERLGEPGGNMHRERFAAEVLEPIAKGIPFAYRPLDCSTLTLRDPVQVQPKAVNLIEGSYSMHPDLRQYYDLSVFLSIDPQKQISRIRRRNGDEEAEVYANRWIPFEKRYHQAFDVKNACTLTLDFFGSERED